MKLRPSIFLTTALLVLGVSGPTLKAGDASANPTGKWKWFAPINPDGKTPEITFNLKLQGETLTGSVTKSKGTTSITNGMCKGNEVSFQTVVEGKNGKRTTTYSGKLNGDSIKGRIEASGGGLNTSTDWEARRVKE